MIHRVSVPVLKLRFFYVSLERFRVKEDENVKSDQSTGGAGGGVRANAKELFGCRSGSRPHLVSRTRHPSLELSIPRQTRPGPAPVCARSKLKGDARQSRARRNSTCRHKSGPGR